jgi:hypothetical protein
MAKKSFGVVMEFPDLSGKGIQTNVALRVMHL